MALFKVNPAGQPVKIDFSVNLSVHIFRAFSVWDAAGKLVVASTLAPATPYGVPDFTFDATVRLPGTLSCLFNCLGPAENVGQPLNITVHIEQPGGLKKDIQLKTALMKGKSGNGGVTVAHHQKTAWIGLVQCSSN